MILGMANISLESLDLDPLQGEHLGLPGWAWPLIGLSAGLLLVAVVYGTCFVDPTCE